MDQESHPPKRQLNLIFDPTYLQRKSWIDEAEIPPVKGVSQAAMKMVLHRIHDHYGRNNKSWPSQTLLAELTNYSTRQIERAISALDSLSLICIERKGRGQGRNGVFNCYKIVWTEVTLLEPERRRSWLQSLGLLLADQTDMVSDQTDMVSDQTDMVSDQTDMVSDKQLTNNSKNKLTNNSPLRTGQANVSGELISPDDPADEWVVVVSDLNCLGMKAAEKAVRVARSHGRSVAWVRDVSELWQRRQASQTAEPISYLYHWIIGTHEPPWDSHGAVNDLDSKPLNRTSMLSSTQQWKQDRDNLDVRIRKELRKLAWHSLEDVWSIRADHHVAIDEHR